MRFARMQGEEPISPTRSKAQLDRAVPHRGITITFLIAKAGAQKEVLRTFETTLCCPKIVRFGSVLGLFLSTTYRLIRSYICFEVFRKTLSKGIAARAKPRAQ